MPSPLRWWVLTLLFLGTTVNYLDRIILGILLPEIRKEIPLSDVLYGQISSAFQLSYTIGFLLAGKFIDMVGTRLGYAGAILWWSLAATAHSFIRNPFTFAVCRALLGVGEAGNFPAAIKSVSEWFPKKDRALATGIFNAGTNVATMIGPGIFWWMTSLYGWRTCFLITAASGFLVLVLWFFTRQTPPPQDDDGPGGEKLSWGQVARYRETWGFALAKFFSDPVWWFYLFWLPPYFYDVRHFDMKQVSWAFPFIYLMADIGSVAGGWISGYFLRQGWTVARARKVSMGIFAGCMPVAATSVLFENPFVAIGLISLATAAHQGWSANLYTTVSDVFPKSAVASATGIGASVGGLGGVIFSTLLPGYIVTYFGYGPMFFIMGGFHLTGLLCLHRLMGSLKPIVR
ncbi:MAG: MFS transporter [Bryobacter sp.]|jgi:ACS family hexuronate transporter-like MFS transporter|nr:MFS transporter [Bryobacter sp. CoA8 C33]